MDPQLLFYAVLLFLLTIGLYCLLLTILNRRPRPVMLAGMLDAAAMLLAAAGFFLVLLPAILHTFENHLLRGHLADAPDQFDVFVVFSWALWLGYYAVLIVGAALFVFSRRDTTVIFNVETDLFLDLVPRAAAQAGLEVTREENRFILHTPSAAATAISAEPLASSPLVKSLSDRANAILEVDPFAAGSHVTLRWRNYRPEVRRLVERALDKRLDEARAPDNPVAGWFLLLSSLVFGLVALVIAVVVVLDLRGRH